MGRSATTPAVRRPRQDGSTRWLQLLCPGCGVVLGSVGVLPAQGVAWYGHAIGVVGDPDPGGEVRVGGRKWGKRAAFMESDQVWPPPRLLFVCPRSDKSRCMWRKLVRYETFVAAAVIAARAGQDSFHL